MGLPTQSPSGVLAAAEWSTIAQNSRIARVVVTATDAWGTVWRADLEGGEGGAERRVCTRNYSSSRPLEGPFDRLTPLPEISGAAVR